jgi:hypothetical protein
MKSLQPGVDQTVFSLISAVLFNQRYKSAGIDTTAKEQKKAFVETSNSDILRASMIK